MGFPVSKPSAFAFTQRNFTTRGLVFSHALGSHIIRRANDAFSRSSCTWQAMLSVGRCGAQTVFLMRNLGNCALVTFLCFGSFALIFPVRDFGRHGSVRARRIPGLAPEAWFGQAAQSILVVRLIKNPNAITKSFYCSLNVKGV